MKYFYSISLTVLFLLYGINIMAQGFNSTNNRNHPELNWQVAETEHYLIMYPQRLDGIQYETAAIAEETYEVLSNNLEVEFDQKIRIYLSDEDEVNNGFAVPFSRPYTDIWVNLNDYSEIWTGNEKWLRKVVAHELAHIFHFEAVRSPIGLLQFAFANPLPSFWAEGLAQYETEKWDSQRGDRWLRKAIFDDNMDFNSGQSIEDGRLRYALGNAQLRYFTEKYGDSSLVNLLHHRDKALGFIEYHDFSKAFDEVIDGGYQSFYDDWRKHKNVYYNTVAGQMERVDSLGGTAFNFPGQFYFDAAVSPNDSLIAVYSITSMSRPVRRLHVVTNDSNKTTKLVAEGGINSDLHWLSDQKLLYSRLVREENASLFNDVFLYDLEKEKEIRITKSRKAKFPIKTSNDQEIAYIVNEDGTGNLFTHNLESGEEERITNYSDDVQLLWPLWIPSQNQWLMHKFQANGDRNLILINPQTGEETIIDSSSIDNRKPVLSPEGNKIAYQSLRDEVPNIFIYDFETKEEYRATNLFTGGEVFGWLSSVDTSATEQFLIGASESRNKDNLYLVDVDRKVYKPQLEFPASYSSWRTHRPPMEISSSIEPDSDLITNSYSYNSLKNLTHVVSFAFPYYSDENDWGLFATTNWTEPLGKHTISAGGWLSIPEPQNNSYGAFSYINNQFYPSLIFNIYKAPDNGQFYGDEYLFEEYTGADLTIQWPLNIFQAPYQGSQWSLRFRYYKTEPFGVNRFTNKPNLITPVSASVTDAKFSWQIKKQRPWKDNNFHPLDGYGIRFDVNAAGKILGSDVNAVTTNIHAYTIQPGPGLQRFFLKGRFQSQWGNQLPQNYIGLSRYDNVSFDLPGEIPFTLFGNNERVRGYRNFVRGEQVAFGSLEYRIPLIPSLQTEILGLIRFGGVNAALFTDAAIVWEGQSTAGETGTIRQWGAGAEFKNQLSLFGLSVTHALGLAKPAEILFDESSFNLYYRVKASIPF